MILGGLTGSHLGHVVTFTDGGATYTGALHRVQHELESWRAHQRRLRTTVVLRHVGWQQGEKWVHAGTYSSFTAVTVDPPVAVSGQMPASAGINGV